MSSVFDALQLQRIAQAIEDGQAGATATATVNLDFSNVGDMTGATTGTAGTHGLVPAPAAGDQDKTLHGDGTWRADTADLPQVFGSGSGSIITLTDAADYAASDLVIDIDPVQSGSGDPSPDNIRPISGWTGCNVWRTGKNLIDADTYYGTYKQSDGSFVSVGSKFNQIAIPIPAQLVGKKVTFSAKLKIPSGSAINNIRVRAIVNGASVHGTFVNTEDYKLSSVTVIPLSDNDVFGITYGSNGSQNMQFKDVQLEFGSTVTDFEEYQGTTYPIPFPSEAGTVYGGTLDVVNGVLTVTKANIASYAGETLPGAWISDRDVYDPDNPTTPTTGAQVVYDLDTPLSYQVISTDVYLISGTCNVWADTGDIITLEYVKADYNDLMQAVPKMKMPDYSTSEQDTGLKWIDGKAIYQKTISFTVAGGGYVSNPTGITGIDTLIKHEGIGRITDYIIDETPYKNPPTNDYSIAIVYFFIGGELYADYRATAEAVGADFYITFWYTKI